MTIATRTKLGRYEIRSKIGAVGWEKCIWLEKPCQERSWLVWIKMDPAPKQLNVVLNLFEELKRRVPIEKN